MLPTITCAATYSCFPDGDWEGAPYPGGLAVFQQRQFLCGQNQGCQPPFAVLTVFHKEKKVQTCVTSQLPFGHLCGPGRSSSKAPCGFTASMFHSGVLTQKAIMPGGWQIPSCQQKKCLVILSSSAYTSRHLTEEAGGDERRQCPAVHFSHLHGLLIFKEFPLLRGSYCSAHLVYHHPRYTDGLGFSHCQFFLLTLK